MSKAFHYSFKKLLTWENMGIAAAAGLYVVYILWSGGTYKSAIINTLWVAAVALAGLSHVFQNKMKIRIKKQPVFYYLWLVLFLGVCFLSTMWATNASLAKNRASFLLRIALSMAVLAFIFQDGRTYRTRDLLKAIELGGHATGIMVIALNGFRAIMTKIQLSDRLSDTGLNSNTFGLVVAFSFLITIYFISTEGFKLSSLLLIPSTIIIVASGSRKTIAVMVLGTIAMLFLNSSRKGHFLLSMLRIILIAAAAAVAIYFLLKLPFMKLIQTRVEGMIAGILNADRTLVDGSTRVRMMLKQDGLALFSQKPLTGYGLDNAKLFNSYGYYMHDNFVEMLANLGLVGFCCYYVIYAVIIISLLKRFDIQDKEFNICLTLIAVVLLMDYGRVSYYNLSTYYILLLGFIKAQKTKACARSRKRNALGIQRRNYIYESA